MKKKNLRILLWVNTVLEGLVGLAFWVYPGVIAWFPETFGSLDPGAHRLILAMYGTAALSIGLLSGLMLRETWPEGLFSKGLLLFGIFHTGLSIALFAFSQDPRPSMLHLALALAFFWHYIHIIRK